MKQPKQEWEEKIGNMILEFFPRTVIQEENAGMEIREIDTGDLTKSSIKRLSSLLLSQRKEVIEEMENKVQCLGFSEEPNFRCKKILPIKEMQSTVKNPNRFYCEDCYRRGLEMEYEAMGLR